MHWFAPEVQADLLNTQEHNPKELKKQDKKKTFNLIELELLLIKKNTPMQSKEEGKYQESIQSSSTPDPRHHMGK